MEWKDEYKYNNFMLELDNYLGQYNSINTHSLPYSKGLTDFFSSSEEKIYYFMHDLCDFLFEYWERYQLQDVNMDVAYGEFSVAIKYNNKFFGISLSSVIGGEAIFIKLLKNAPIFYIDYDLVIKNIIPENYKEMIKEYLESELNKIKMSNQDILDILNWDIKLISKSV